VERRRSKRVDSIKPLGVDFPDEDDRPAGIKYGRALNIGRGGAEVEIRSSTPFSIPVGRELRLTIPFGGKAIPVRGRVVHGRQTDERQVVVGVLFTEILPDDRRTIADFIRERV